MQGLYREALILLRKSKEAGLTTSGNLTDAERRAIDAADRASVSQGYMEYGDVWRC